MSLEFYCAVCGRYTPREHEHLTPAQKMAGLPRKRPVEPSKPLKPIWLRLKESEASYGRWLGWGFVLALVAYLWSIG